MLGITFLIYNGFTRNPSYETTPFFCPVIDCAQLAVEEAVCKNDSIAFMFDVSQIANDATVRAIAISVGKDVNAGATVDDVVARVSSSDDASSFFASFFIDISSHMQVLDGGIKNIAERSAKIFATVVDEVKRDGVSVTVEGASETLALAAAHHLDGSAIGVDGFIDHDVSHQLEVFVAVGAGAVVNILG